jgi:hypothetical protein
VLVDAGLVESGIGLVGTGRGSEGRGPEVGEDEVLAVAPGDDAGGSKGEPVGAGKIPVLKVDPGKVEWALARLLDVAFGGLADEPVLERWASSTHTTMTAATITTMPLIHTTLCEFLSSGFFSPLRT